MISVKKTVCGVERKTWNRNMTGIVNGYGRKNAACFGEPLFCYIGSFAVRQEIFFNTWMGFFRHIEYLMYVRQDEEDFETP